MAVTQTHRIYEWIFKINKKIKSPGIGLMKKSILLIGDLVTANNLGAIATSECLKNLLKMKYPNARISYIDHRSFINQTPINGWPQYRAPIKQKIALKLIFRKIGLLQKSKALLQKIKPHVSTDHVPLKFSQFDHFCEQILKGRILQYEYSLIKQSEVIIINGEGNIVHGVDKFGRYRIGARYILFLAYFIKKHFNEKYCSIINHTVDPDSSAAIQMIQHVYPLLDKISVREPLSVKKLAEIGLVDRIEFVPDALFTYSPLNEWSPPKWLSKQINFKKPFICIGDSSGIRSSSGQTVRWSVIKTFSELIAKLKDICPQIIFIDGFSFGNELINKTIRKNKIVHVNINNCNYHDIYYLLKQSVLFISGRWHASILALLGETPIITWGADSHKTRALYSLLPGYPNYFYSINELPIYIDDIVATAKTIFDDPQRFANIIRLHLPELKKSAFQNGDLSFVR